MQNFEVLDKSERISCISGVFLEWYRFHRYCVRGIVVVRADSGNPCARRGGPSPTAALRFPAAALALFRPRAGKIHRPRTWNQRNPHFPLYALSTTDTARKEVKGTDP